MRYVNASKTKNRQRRVCRFGPEWILAAAALLLLTLPVAAQPPGNDTGPTVDKDRKAEIIDSVTAAVNTYYVYPDKAGDMEKRVRERFEAGAYDTITTTAAFARAISEDMFEVCQDRHFGVRYIPADQLERMLDEEPTPEQREQELEKARRENFGFKKVELLGGNIGYLKFDGFSGYADAGPTAIGAMNFLGNVDALIIDLRENGGGSPNMIQIISSYFFDEPTHLNTFYIRETDSLEQFWTTNYVDGKRLDDVDLYVLTSSYTFSAAEEFTYNLKNLERATIVGETTGGGAHPVSAHGWPGLEVAARIPFGKAINPVSGTNWEGTGIEPHIACKADDALAVARLDAMKKLKEKAADPQVEEDMAWHIATLEAQLNPVTVDDAVLQSYAGDYGPRHIMYEDGTLWYQRDERPKYKMIPMSDETFYFDELDYFRLHFVKNNAGEVAVLEGHYLGGRVDRNARD